MAMEGTVLRVTPRRRGEDAPLSFAEVRALRAMLHKAGVRREIPSGGEWIALHSEADRDMFTRLRAAVAAWPFGSLDALREAARGRFAARWDAAARIGDADALFALHMERQAGEKRARALSLGVAA